MEQDPHEKSSHLIGKLPVFDHVLDDVKAVHLLQGVKCLSVPPEAQLGGQINETEKVAIGLLLELAVETEAHPVALAVLTSAVHEHVDLAVILHSDWHHKEGTRVLIFEEHLCNVILIVDDRLSITRTDGLKKLD